MSRKHFKGSDAIHKPLREAGGAENGAATSDVSWQKIGTPEIDMYLPGWTKDKGSVSLYLTVRI